LSLQTEFARSIDMELSPRVLGVGAAVLVAGILGGAALGTVPPMQQRGVQDMLPEARPVAADHRAQGDLPDHYPLVTRAGRFEVHELGERGLYSQARYAYRDAYAYYSEGDWDQAGYEADFAAEQEPTVVAATEPPADDPTAPLEPAGPAVAEVTPRIIDVAAQLAARDGNDATVSLR
jgi:hypothetical protein